MLGLNSSVKTPALSPILELIGCYYLITYDLVFCIIEETAFKNDEIIV